MATSFNTPGVYIEEKNAFTSSIAAVATSIPVFIGYTQKAERNGRSVLNTPVRITSLAEYVALFGYGFVTKFRLEDATAQDMNGIVMKDGKRMKAVPVPGTMFYLFNCIRWFYANGGSTCYIYAVKTYRDTANGFMADVQDFIGGSYPVLEQLKKEHEPTMVLAPDAVLLGDEAYTVYREILQHCAAMQNRLGIFDVGYQHANETTADKIATFRKAIGNEHLGYGAAYYPWLKTAVTGEQDVDFNNMETGAGIKMLLPEAVVQQVVQPTAKQLEDPRVRLQYHQALLATSPTYQSLMHQVRSKLNELPPSAAMAGIYTFTDNTRGVWKAPANIEVTQVVDTMVRVTDDMQESLNFDIEGKSVNVLRNFAGKGVLVWGARTLDGNSQDWRYINVRRTMMMIEQSVKLAVHGYIFALNDATTWATLKRMITDFLHNQWKQGALAGAKPDDAFSVQVGLGDTMTAEDILDGIMRVTVLAAAVRPAEFIVLTFEQQQQG